MISRKTITLMIGITLALMLSLSFSSRAQMLKSKLNVSDLLKLTSRQVEQLDTFYLSGKAGKCVNIGFANYYTLYDPNCGEEYVFITSEKKTLLEPGCYVLLRVTLYTELRWDMKSVLVLKELKQQTQGRRIK